MELKNTFYGIICSLCFTTVTYSQVGIGTLNPDQSSQLDITTTNKGLLIPRVQLIVPFSKRRRIEHSL